MKSCKQAWIGWTAAMFIGAVCTAACNASVVVEGGTAGAGADDSASSGGEAGFGGECAGILARRDECPLECEDKRVLCDREEGPVDEEGLGVKLCAPCEHCGADGRSWLCTTGS